MRFPRQTDWVGELVPDMQTRMGQFVADIDELDDELIEVFKSEIIRLTDEMKGGLNAGDREQIRVAAHSIKGMGGSVGLPEISVLAHEIELMAKENNLERCQELGNALISWAGKFRAEE